MAAAASIMQPTATVPAVRATRLRPGVLIQGVHASTATPAPTPVTPGSMAAAKVAVAFTCPAHSDAGRLLLQLPERVLAVAAAEERAALAAASSRLQGGSILLAGLALTLSQRDTCIAKLAALQAAAVAAAGARYAAALRRSADGMAVAAAAPVPASVSPSASASLSSSSRDPRAGPQRERKDPQLPRAAQQRTWDQEARAGAAAATEQVHGGADAGRSSDGRGSGGGGVGATARAAREPAATAAAEVVVVEHSAAAGAASSCWNALRVRHHGSSGRLECCWYSGAAAPGPGRPSPPGSVASPLMPGARAPHPAPSPREPSATRPPPPLTSAPPPPSPPPGVWTTLAIEQLPAPLAHSVRLAALRAALGRLGARDGGPLAASPELLDHAGRCSRCRWWLRARAALKWTALAAAALALALALTLTTSSWQWWAAAKALKAGPLAAL